MNGKLVRAFVERGLPAFQKAVTGESLEDSRQQIALNACLLSDGVPKEKPETERLKILFYRSRCALWKQARRNILRRRSEKSWTPPRSFDHERFEQIATSVEESLRRKSFLHALVWQYLVSCARTERRANITRLSGFLRCSRGKVYALIEDIKVVLKELL